MDNNFICGRNCVKEAIKSQRNISCIFIDKRVKDKKCSISPILSMAKESGIPIKPVDAKALYNKSQTVNHQGIVALVERYKYCSVEDILEVAKEKSEPPFIVLADGIEDPHNLGAIIRTAECAGVHGVIIPKHNCVGITSAVEKTAVGALEHIKVAKVTNLVRTIGDLKKVGLWVYCADMDGQTYWSFDYTGPVALVVGSEGMGVSHLVKGSCDFVATLPMKGHISSLNASVAAGILMYEICKTRTLKNKPIT
ncbi:MAG: 23S rRNA (guanosine(2251)-2'-O)-methyltransferase RlmB [Clostridia bacterium]|nr:23S rRNA (guanosine(2251)-2'-O)-methyltransferase RlmB [Clostridia bacterium]